MLLLLMLLLLMYCLLIDARCLDLCLLVDN